MKRTLGVEFHSSTIFRTKITNRELQKAAISVLATIIINNLVRIMNIKFFFVVTCRVFFNCLQFNLLVCWCVFNQSNNLLKTSLNLEIILINWQQIFQTKK